MPHTDGNCPERMSHTDGNCCSRLFPVTENVASTEGNPMLVKIYLEKLVKPPTMVTVATGVRDQKQGNDGVSKDH